MQRLYADVAGIAATDATVLLQGETGVGKTWWPGISTSMRPGPIVVYQG